VCEWQVKLCDPLVTHGLYLSASEIRSLYIKRYINSAVYLLIYQHDTTVQYTLINNVHSCVFRNSVSGRPNGDLGNGSPQQGPGQSLGEVWTQKHGPNGEFGIL